MKKGTKYRLLSSYATHQHIAAAADVSIAHDSRGGRGGEGKGQREKTETSPDQTASHI